MGRSPLLCVKKGGLKPTKREQNYSPRGFPKPPPGVPKNSPGGENFGFGLLEQKPPEKKEIWIPRHIPVSPQRGNLGTPTVNESWGPAQPGWEIWGWNPNTWGQTLLFAHNTKCVVCSSFLGVAKFFLPNLFPGPKRTKGVPPNPQF